MMPELLPAVDVKMCSWKASLKHLLHFVDCFPFASLKHIFETMHGLFLSVKIPAFQIQLLP